MPQRSVVPRLGIVGGGQLAKMTTAAAAQLGCEVVVLERQDEFPAHAVDTQALIGDWDDPRELERLARLVDVVTLENELVDAGALAALEASGHRLLPSAACVGQVQDKLYQKEACRAAGIPVPRFAPAPAREAVRAFGAPAVLKRRRGGYDGRGNATVDAAADADAAWTALGGDRHALYIEEFCDFARELAVIVTRGRDGDTICYPVVETVNRHHICHEVLAPAAVEPRLAAAAAELAREAVAVVGGVGSFGVELFVRSDGALLLNELAPRVHNTGHYTIEGCACSQFENHVRAVLGWPLGSPAMVRPAAAMVNLLGAGDGPGTPHGLGDALRVRGARVHVYGKAKSRRGRKMGHVTALGATVSEALATARRAAERIRFGRTGDDERPAAGRDHHGERVGLAHAAAGG